MVAVVRSVGCSHVGLVRKHNEDSYLERPDLGLWVVADGMGGATAGEVASRAIVEALDGISPGEDAAGLMREVRRRVSAVNEALLAMAQARGQNVVIGSTIAGLLLREGHFAVFWAGDSRVYRYRGGEMDRLTRDHSLVQDMVDAGLLAASEAESHPNASVIQRAVGVDETIALEMVHAAARAGDVFLLCSDGLTRMVGDEELEAELGRGDLAGVSERLLSLVLARGAKDNVTIVLVEAGALALSEDATVMLQPWS